MHRAESGPRGLARRVTQAVSDGLPAALGCYPSPR